MLTSLRKSFVTLVASLMLIAVPVAVPAMAFADATSDIQNGLACGTNLQTDTSSTCTTTTGSDHLTSMITTIVKLFSAIVGIVAVIMIIFAGLRYITANGDSGNIQTARQTITYAILGLIIVALAQFIVQFVVNKATTSGS